MASCSISFSALPYFKRLVEWADVVHYHYPWPFADLLHFAARVRKPTVLTYHSDIVPPGSANGLRQAMDELHFRPEMAELMGQRARKRYEQLFTGQLMGHRYIEVYRALTSNGAEEATMCTRQREEISLRIGVDARPLAVPTTGIGRYTHEIVRRLIDTEHQLFLYTVASFLIEFSQPNVTIHTTPVQWQKLLGIELARQRPETGARATR